MEFNQVMETLKQFNPISIFMYGSQANNSTNEDSDYEIGVVFSDDKYINRSTIKQQCPDKQYSIFPFKKSELLNHSIDTPFQKEIYIASLISGNAKTIYGEKIIENLSLPKIEKCELLMDSSFNLGYALSAVRLMKSGNIELANEFLYKSMFYATRNLIFAFKGKLISGYNNIYDQSKQLDIPSEYVALLELGYKLRNKQIAEVEDNMFYKNISYINKYVIPQIKQRFDK